MKEPNKYSGHVLPDLGGSRIDAQWSRISEQLPLSKTSRRVSPWLAAGLVAALCALAFVWVGERSALPVASVWEGSVVASDEAPVNLTLPEGTLIELDPRSQVSLMHSAPDRVQVSLTDGSARFEVAKKRSRRFSVQLGAVEVLVTGTQFRVARAEVTGGERVRVDVEEGSVEVYRSGGKAVTLEAGDHWSAFVAHDQLAGQPLGGEAEPVSVQEAPAVPSRVAADDSGPPSEPPGEAEPLTHAERRNRAKPPEADELFEQANVARRAGRITEAAKLFADLVARHPSDPRAALAAFELGRLRMDSLWDVPGAIEALERSLKLDARRAFAEDALARLVLAHEALGDRAECTKARARYLARYPEGVHARHIALRCSGI